MRRPGIAVLVLVFASVAAGCGSPSDGTGDDGAADSGGETLSDFIPGAPSFDIDDQAAAEAQFRQQEQQVQEAIRECMAAEGFEYVPYVPSQDSFYGGPETEEEYAREFGLGLAPEILRQGDFDEAAEQEFIDDNPNTAIVDAMSDAERDEYYQVLYGDSPEIDESMTEEEIDALFQDFEPSGCEPDAYNEVFNAGASQAFYEQFGQELEDSFLRIESDPRIAELEQQWSSCMADKGYDFTDEQDATAYILRKLEEVGAVTDVDIDPEGFGYGFGSEPIEPGSAKEAAVQEIADEEIEIALASVECRQGSQEVYIEVYQEYEARFIEEHRAELEQFRDENS